MKVFIFILIILSLVTITFSITTDNGKGIVISEKMATAISKFCGFVAAVLYAIFIL